MRVFCVPFMVLLLIARGRADEAEPVKTGPGLKAEIFAGEELDRPVATRIDSRLNFFGFESTAPDPAVPSNTYSIRWSGFLRPTVRGPIRLSFYIDGAMRLEVGGKRMLDMWGEDHCTPEVTLDSVGKPIPIRIEFRRRMRHRYAACCVYWKLPGQSIATLIPAEAFALDERSRTAPPKRKPEHGLMVETFAGTEFQKPLSSGYTYSVSWILPSAAAPFGNCPAAAFSLRYTADFSATAPGEYTLMVPHGGGARLWLDDVLVVDGWKEDYANPRATVRFDDRPKRLRLEYRQIGSYKFLGLHWQPPGVTAVLPVPPTAFAPQRPGSGKSKKSP